MLTDSFGRMLVIATTVGAISGFVGMNLSYHLDIASGPVIVLVSTMFFLAAYASGGRLRRRAGAVAHAH
jgi:manganese/iron transport system permease protein/iron/zinc/copper transport system permease protein